MRAAFLADIAGPCVCSLVLTAICLCRFTVSGSHGRNASAASAGVGKYRKFVEPHTHWGSLIILEPRIVDFGLETVGGRILDFPKSKSGLDAAAFAHTLTVGGAELQNTFVCKAGHDTHHPRHCNAHGLTGVAQCAKVMLVMVDDRSVEDPRNESLSAAMRSFALAVAINSAYAKRHSCANQHLRILSIDWISCQRPVTRQQQAAMPFVPQIRLCARPSGGQPSVRHECDNEGRAAGGALGANSRRSCGGMPPSDRWSTSCAVVYVTPGHNYVSHTYIGVCYPQACAAIPVDPSND